jgi:hypothetical protein
MSAGLLAVSLAALVGVGSLQAHEDPHAAVVKGYMESIKKGEDKASLVKAALDQLSTSLSGLIEAREFAELGAMLPRGRQFQVFVLYKRLINPEGETRDVLQEVSPHPFGNFLRSSTNYVMERKFVVGNGAYGGFGVPAYPGARELVPYVRGIDVLDAPMDDRRVAQLNAQWQLYKLTVDLWKERRFEKPPALYAPVGNVGTVGAAPQFRPRERILDEAREALNDLEKTLDAVQTSFAQQQRAFEVSISGQPLTADVLEARRRGEEFRARLALLRTYFETAQGIGVAPAAARDDAALYRVMEFVSRELRQRVDQYDTELARQREAQRRLAALRAEAEQTARRTAWKYVTALVGDVCDDPQQLPASFGVELARSDFTYFLIKDGNLNGCQSHLLVRMLELPAPMPLNELAQLAAKYRLEHPTLRQRIERGLRAIGAELVRLIEAIGAPFSAMGSDPSSSGGSSSARSDRSTGVTSSSSNARTINLSRPDFDQGPGSGLGR